MPTKAEKSGGFFEKIGKKVDSFIALIATRINRIRNRYNLINTDYVKIVRSHKISRILPPSLIILALFFIMVPIFATQVINNDKLLYDNQFDTPLTPTEPIREGRITQKIYDGRNIKISNIGVLIGTHKRLNQADYLFRLEKNNEIIFSETFSASRLSDNKYHNFEFDTIQLGEGDEYSFSIEALNADEYNAISLYRNNKTGEITYRLNCKSPFRTSIILISTTFLVLYCIINLLINSGKIKTEFHFLACMLIFIIPLFFIYPVYTIPDEPYHFLAATRLAKYDVSESLSQNLSRTEIDLPENSECLTSYYLGNSGQVDEDGLARCFSSAPSKSGKYVNADNSSRILAYIPSAIGVTIGDLISDSPMVIFYCGRIFNFIAVSSIIIFALSLIKKYRIIILSVVMIPMFLQQACSYSYDGILNAFCLLIIAYSIRFLTMDAKLRKRDIVAMVIAMAFIGLIKPLYIAVITPLLFVKTEKFNSKHKWVKWLTIVSLIIVAVLPYMVDACIAPPSTESAANSGRGLPLESLFISPYATIKMFARTLYSLGSFYITSMIGYFGWFYFALNPILIVAYVSFLIVITLSTEEIKLSKSARRIIFLASLAVIGSTFLAMYIGHTTKNAVVIEGVQGRYFLPVLPLLMLVFMPKQKYVKLQDTTCYAFLNFTTLCYVVTLLIGFY